MRALNTELPERRPAAMDFARRWYLQCRILVRFLNEYLVYDSAVTRFLAGLIGWLVGMTVYRYGRRAAGFGILSKVHRSGCLEWSSRRVERLIRDAAGAGKQGASHPLSQVYDDFVRDAAPADHTRRFFDNPEKVLDGNVIVLKSPRVNEKGVILLYYSYTYQCFAKLFDLDAVMQQYRLVLEPSWSGLCDLNVLLFTQKRQPVFVGSIEPRDAAFIQRLSSNLVPVYFGNNTWVDHRVFRPLAGVEKDLDIVMVAGWGGYKRHWAFFWALRKLCKRGVRPRVALVGYPLGDSKEGLRRQAELLGVGDLLEFHEWLGPDDVNRLFNRAKVNVLWSRREGSPRAIIEGMFAGVPCVVREGFNFGHRYPHINGQTGRFSTESGLADTLLEMITTYQAYSPREWVMKHMSCERTTARLNEAIKAKAVELGETWTTDLAVKTNELNGVRYWELEDRRRFAADYEFLRSTMCRRDSTAGTVAD
jgi:glycosyltransferase involved in cell wall biosynthesis